MEYTIEDLRGKYVKVGTPEAEIFLDACDELGVTWRSGTNARDYKPILKFITIGFDGKLMGINHCIDFLPFTLKPQWSIYTNDKPLCELSDEQAAALFNAWRSGAKVELLADNSDWCNAIPDWSNDIVYRIKQKSDRELFIEEIERVIGYTDLPTLKIGTELFDSGKFKLIKDGE